MHTLHRVKRIEVNGQRFSEAGCDITTPLVDIAGLALVRSNNRSILVHRYSYVLVDFFGCYWYFCLATDVALR